VLIRPLRVAYVSRTALRRSDAPSTEDASTRPTRVDIVSRMARRNTFIHAPSSARGGRHARTMPRREVYVLHMVPRKSGNNVAFQVGVPIKLSREEYASLTAPRRHVNCAPSTVDVPTVPFKGGCVLLMVHKSSDVVLLVDVRNKPRREECVSHMAPMSRINDAPSRTVRSLPKGKEDSVLHTVERWQR